jgi:plasmid stabilization system protein ParE
VTSVVWSPQALLDLQSIRDYIAHDSPRYADLVVHRLVADEAIREVIVRLYRNVVRVAF